MRHFSLTMTSLLQGFEFGEFFENWVWLKVPCFTGLKGKKMHEKTLVCFFFRSLVFSEWWSSYSYLLVPILPFGLVAWAYSETFSDPTTLIKIAEYYLNCHLPRTWSLSTHFWNRTAALVDLGTINLKQLQNETGLKFYSRQLIILVIIMISIYMYKCRSFNSDPDFRQWCNWL